MSLPSQKDRCQCLTGKGTQCKNKRKTTKYCGVHKKCKNSLGKFSKKTKKVPKKKSCKRGYMINPNTGRCIKRNGPTAKKLFAKKTSKTKRSKAKFKNLKIDELMANNKGLTAAERKYLSSHLTKEGVFDLVNARYAPDPQRYGKMSKRQLVAELKYPRYI